MSVILVPINKKQCSDSFVHLPLIHLECGCHRACTEQATWLMCAVVTCIIIIIINPRCMHESNGSRSVRVCVCVCMCVCVCVCLSVCVSVTMLTATCLAFFIEIQVSLGFPCCFQCMHCVDFAEKALFKSSGDICGSKLSLLRFLASSRWTNETAMA